MVSRHPVAWRQVEGLEMALHVTGLQAEVDDRASTACREPGARLEGAISAPVDLESLAGRRSVDVLHHAGFH